MSVERLCLPRARLADKRAQHAGFGFMSVVGTEFALFSAFRTIFLDLCLDLAFRFTIFIGWSPVFGYDRLVLLDVSGGTSPDDFGRISELVIGLGLESSIGKLGR